LVAGRTGARIGGLDDGAPHLAPLSGLSSATAAVLSTATMADDDGAWATLIGDDPVRPDSLELAAVEDGWRDAERSHGPEDVAFVVVGQASGVSPAVGGRPRTPGLTSITPRITITRTEGTEPFVVQVSAAETLVDAGDAFTDLEYTWDFGDARGREFITNPV